MSEKKRSQTKPSADAPVEVNDAAAKAPENATHNDGGRQSYAHSDRRNSSIVVGPKTIATVAGPINEWACIPENLPNHPTMVTLLFVLFALSCSVSRGGRLRLSHALFKIPRAAFSGLGKRVRQVQTYELAGCEDQIKLQAISFCLLYDLRFVRNPHL